MQLSAGYRVRSNDGFRLAGVDFTAPKGGGGLTYPRVGSPAGTGDKSPARVLRVLIVDDNVGLAENIAELLESDGCSTEIAASAEEAMPKALAQEFSVVITDFRLPGVSGVDFIRALRAKRYDAQAIVISAYGDDDTIDAARQVGARFLEKPLDFAALNQFILAAEGQA